MYKQPDEKPITSRHTPELVPDLHPCLEMKRDKVVTVGVSNDCAKRLEDNDSKPTPHVTEEPRITTF